MEWFDQLVEVICGLGAPIKLYASDKILCLDLYLLRDLTPSARRNWLQKAKREALERYLRDEIDQIREAAENDAENGSNDAADELARFIPDDFDRRPDGKSIPPSHAVLVRHFYGKLLSARDIRRWTRLARQAAKPPNAAERACTSPVVYFISIDDLATVKIGFSANFQHRLRSLRTASPVEPHVHAVVSGSKQLEAELHDRFRTDHIRREWFRLSQDIADFIRDQNSQESERVHRG